MRLRLRSSTPTISASLYARQCSPVSQLSTMAAGTHVRPHTGPTNAKLTVHYGLEVPFGCALRVVGETRPFATKGLLVFDDSWEHEVWNNGTGHRTTLVLHVQHPQLRTAAYS